MAGVASVHPKLWARFRVRGRRIGCYFTCDEAGRNKRLCDDIARYTGESPFFSKWSVLWFFRSLASVAKYRAREVVGGSLGSIFRSSDTDLERSHK